MSGPPYPVTERTILTSVAIDGRTFKVDPPIAIGPRDKITVGYVKGDTQVTLTVDRHTKDGDS